ncbi:ammonium transporter [bacterium]|nr:ammonium transporter [Balneola sp.]MBR9918286.1 ammonium transporter [bacterium]
MKRLYATTILIFISSNSLFSQGELPTINAGDTAWVLMATALVMLMTPAGLALFYGGLTQNKHVLNTIGMSYMAFCTGTLVWVIIGYSLAFSEGNAFIGGFDNFLLQGITVSDISGSIPTILFVVFQGTFAAIAVAIVSGSIIERVRFSTWGIFSILWVIIVYAPIAHWVWGRGFLSESGEMDFAGGTVIHVNAGVAGLVLSYLVGKRKEHSLEEVRKPSSIKFMILGSALLWFGWFGFNGGSQLAADGIAANALLVTNIAACAGALIWLTIEWFIVKKPTLIGMASGAISGLVGITPASGYVDVTGALAIGLLSGIVGYWGVVHLKSLMNHDDTLDAFGIHGLVGIFGALATGIFANPEINNGAGLLYGNPGQLLVQAKAVLITIAYSGTATYVTWKISSLITSGGRIEEKLELEGMDIGYHGEHHIIIGDSQVVSQSNSTSFN